MSPADIADALRLAYRRPTVLDRLRSVAAAFGVSTVPMIAAWAAVLGISDGDVPIDRLVVQHPLLFLGVAAAATLLSLLALGRRGRFRLYGFQWPQGFRWMLVMPVVLLGAVAGGAWLFWPVSFAGRIPGPSGWTSWATLLGFPLLAEMLFRGLAHGLMIENFSVQHSHGRWFVSWPVALSALFFAVWTVPFINLTLAGEIWPLASWISVPLGALACGVGFGISRERSGSLLAPLALHYMALLAVVIASALLR